MQSNRTQWSRRNFLRLGGASALAGVSPAISQAKAEEILASPVNPKPVVDARFPCRIGDGVWVIPDKRIFLVPNIGIVEGKHSVLVIDSGLGPESGRNVLSAARAIAGKRRLILTMTHAHPEHTFGAQAFKGEAQIFYDRAQRDHLARSAKVLLQGFHSALLQNQLALLDQIEITTPDDVYQEDKTEIDLGDRRVELRSIGTAHSPGDQIITI